MEHIAHEAQDPDAWVCLCGNTPVADGFFPCDLDGRLVEPTPREWTTSTYRCERCGRIINQHTLEVVAGGPAVKQLPIVRYEDRLWFFDARLRQIRPTLPPLEFRELNDVEVAYFQDLVDRGETEPLPHETHHSSGA